MHIEPGLISPEKLAIAGVVCAVSVGAFAIHALRAPVLILRTMIAAVFFTVCMQAFHAQVGPSELHFLGAIPIYLTFGFIPTALGFVLGLLLQGIFFEPQDLMNLAVNSLSLIVPLIWMHFAAGKEVGKHASTITVASVVKLDALYYAGVTLMVGFWLSLGETSTPFSDWVRFALSYTVVVAIEPFISLTVLGLVRRWRDNRLVRVCCDVR